MPEGPEDTQGKVAINIDIIATLILSLHIVPKGGFIVTKHRIPEIVVPNLDGFEVQSSISNKTFATIIYHD